MTTEETERTTLSPKRIIVLLAVSVAVATILLVTVVLPAEYEIDPPKTGKLLGISGMSKERIFEPLPQLIAPRIWEMMIVLQPFESLEVKFEITKVGKFDLLLGIRSGIAL